MQIDKGSVNHKNWELTLGIALTGIVAVPNYAPLALDLGE